MLLRRIKHQRIGFRGHQSDWDLFASQAGDSAWGYQSVLKTYPHIEDWHGASKPTQQVHEGALAGV